MSQLQKQKLYSNEEIYYTISESPLGSLLIAKSVKGLCAVFLGDSKIKLEKELKLYFPESTLTADPKRLEKYVDFVKNLMENSLENIQEEFPLDVRGTEFQLQVWKELMLIPKGSTLSYSDIALKMGMPKSFRAVANACGANRVAIVIPCHRVVKKDGSLSGYRWGVSFKRGLLLKENALPLAM